MGKCALRSLSLSYPKKDWRVGPCQSFFGYDTNYDVFGVIPKEGFTGPGPPILLLV